MNKTHKSCCGQSLPGIVKIEMIRCSDLQANIMLHGICGVPVAINAEAEEVPFVGVPTLTWTGSKVNGQREEKSTLEFYSAEELPEDTHYAFVVTTAGGEQRIIGAREGRYPVVNYEDTTGSLTSDRAVRKYKITHIAQKSVLACIL